MEELLEYARVVFEERYMCETSPFVCVKPQVERNFCRCICIPGVAMNYIVYVLGCCYEEFEGERSICWNETRNIYLPDNEYKNQKVVFNLQPVGRYCRCYFSDDLCGERINEFTYIKIRSFDVLYSKYIQKKQIFYKEYLLLGKMEKFDNSMDYLRLFCFIADAYRGTYDIDDFVDKLFRLFLFLFPYTGLNVIEKNIEMYGNSQKFRDYQRQVLQEYRKLGEGKQYEDSMADVKISITIGQLKEFFWFDFWNVYKNYEEAEWGGDTRSLKDILKKQMSICSKLASRISRIVNRL